MQIQKEFIVQKLKEQGCRITKQRLMLLDIILAGGCSCCKEIYYEAAKRDPHIGAATVYRMVNTLEEMGALNRGSMYPVACEEEAQSQRMCSIELSDHTVCRLTEEMWLRALREGMRACGYLKNQKISRVEFFCG